MKWNLFTLTTSTTKTNSLTERNTHQVHTHMTERDYFVIEGNILVEYGSMVNFRFQFTLLGESMCMHWK